MFNRSIHCAHYFKSALHDKNRPQVPSQLSLRKCAKTLPTASVDSVEPSMARSLETFLRCHMSEEPNFSALLGKHSYTASATARYEGLSATRIDLRIRIHLSHKKCAKFFCRFRRLTHEFVSTVKTKHGGEYGNIPQMTFLGAT